MTGTRCPRCAAEVTLHLAEADGAVLELQGVCPARVCGVLVTASIRRPDPARFDCFARRDTPEVVRAFAAVVTEGRVWEFVPADASTPGAMQLCWHTAAPGPA